MELMPGESFRLIEEAIVEGKRLGRHFHLDLRNLEHRALDIVGSIVSLPTADVIHKRMVPAFDQGNLGSCTGNALAGALMTAPEYRPGRSYNEATAVALYSLATSIDPVDGVYPPNDVGSTGPDVCKAARKDGYLRGYMHCFGLNETLTVIQHYPIIIGVNWYDSMDSPDSNSVISISPNASVRGGHEFEVSEVYPERKLVGCWNSWGPSWGKDGQMYMSWNTLERLLNEEGDATLPVV